MIYGQLEKLSGSIWEVNNSYEDVGIGAGTLHQAKGVVPTL